MLEMEERKSGESRCESAKDGKSPWYAKHDKPYIHAERHGNWDKRKDEIVRKSRILNKATHDDVREEKNTRLSLPKHWKTATDLIGPNREFKVVQFLNIPPFACVRKLYCVMKFKFRCCDKL